MSRSQLWTEIYRNWSNNGYIECLSYHPHINTVLCGGYNEVYNGDTLQYDRFPIFYRSINNGYFWYKTQLYGDPPSTNNTGYISGIANNDANVWILLNHNLTTTEIWRSLNHGENFSLKTNISTDTTKQITWGTPISTELGRWIIPTLAKVFISDDNGETWTNVSNGLSNLYLPRTIKYANNIYVIGGLAGNVSNNYGALWKSSNGLNWEMSVIPNSVGDIYGLDFSENNWLVAPLLVSRSKQLYSSPDLSTWTNLSNNAPEYIEYLTSHNGNIFSFSGYPQICKLANGTNIWTNYSNFKLTNTTNYIGGSPILGFINEYGNIFCTTYIADDNNSSYLPSIWFDGIGQSEFNFSGVCYLNNYEINFSDSTISSSSNGNLLLSRCRFHNFPKLIPPYTRPLTSSTKVGYY